MQFDVYENNDPSSNDVIPYLLDVQHDLHSSLATRTVVPLVMTYAEKDQIKRLCPVFNIQGHPVMMSTPEIAGYPARDLGGRVTSLSNQRTEILAAIDFLLSGF